MGNVRVYIGKIGNVKFWSESLKERHTLGYSRVGWQIILQYILNKYSMIM